MARLMKPLAVASNAGINIVAPASPAQPERVELGLAALRSFGYAPKPGQNALKSGPLYFAGTPAQRLADLNAAFADETPPPSWPCAAATDRITCSMA